MADNLREALRGLLGCGCCCTMDYSDDEARENAVIRLVREHVAKEIEALHDPEPGNDAWLLGYNQAIEHATPVARGEQ